ncbi:MULTISPECIES: hypothetical protein [unclassified Luteococcus]|uniref:hypothetical protein n=1 Tax=unclassified Luteococcus TaxID=2639923 RepID=UPI00313C1E19
MNPSDEWVVPDWWTPAAQRKTMAGHIAVRRNGIAEQKGGHRAGRGWPGKTEFPASWGLDQVTRALVLTWCDPDAWTVWGDRRIARRLVDQVLVEVTAHGPGFRSFRACFPVCGVGVRLNLPSGWREVPLQHQRCDEEGWNRRDRRSG